MIQRDEKRKMNFYDSRHALLDLIDKMCLMVVTHWKPFRLCFQLMVNRVATVVVASLFTCDGVLTGARRKELDGRLLKLRGWLALATESTSIAGLDGAGEFLQAFDSRSQNAFHLSQFDESAFKLASKIRECAVTGQELSRELAENLLDDIAHPLPRDFDLRFGKVSQCLSGLRRDILSIDVVYGKFTHHQQMEMLVQESTEDLQCIPTCKVRDRLQRTVQDAQRAFWNAVNTEQVMTALASLVAVLPDLRGWEAIHAASIAEEEALASKAAFDIGEKAEHKRIAVEQKAKRVNDNQAKRKAREEEAIAVPKEKALAGKRAAKAQVKAELIAKVEPIQADAVPVAKDPAVPRLQPDGRQKCADTITRIVVYTAGMRLLSTTTRVVLQASYLTRDTRPLTLPENIAVFSLNVLGTYTLGLWMMRLMLPRQ
jgi:hypothetical protein